jgi:hypothetical protein
VTTTIAYDSTPDLALKAQQSGNPWSLQSPQAVHVVTSITTATILGDSYQTQFSYANPVFDGRDNAFLGFQNVVETSPGEADGLMNTATTYFYAACGAPFGTTCVASEDDSQHSYRGLPVLTEIFNGVRADTRGGISETYLSTTHHSYSAALLYEGSDTRYVRRVYEAETDTYLYDTSPYAASPSHVTIADVSSPDLISAPGFTVRAAAQQLQKMMSLDAIGNITTVTDNGNVTAADPSIWRSTTWGLPSQEDQANEWTWRPMTVSVGASPTDPGPGIRVTTYHPLSIHWGVVSASYESTESAWYFIDEVTWPRGSGSRQG